MWSTHSSDSSSKHSKRSLNSSSRKREDSQIKKENWMMFNKLRKKKSVYNVSQWENENVQRQKLLCSISEYPNNSLELPSIMLK